MTDIQDVTTDTQQPTGDGEKTKITSSIQSVEIMGFSDPIEGKIDTGAAQSSLHATDISVEGGSVTFVLNNRRYRTAAKSTQEVSSADGGQQSRPVIVVSLTIAGKVIPEVSINLNDRSGMPQQLLIGQDVIKAADLVIDISDEPPAEEAGAVPDATLPAVEQEEAASGLAIKPDVTGSSIAQLGDNPQATADDAAVAAQGEQVTLVDIKAQLQDLLSKVDQMIQKAGS